MTWRKIHFEDGEVWEYRIGRGCVVLKSPVNKKFIVSQSAITGRTPDVLERGKWKKTPDGWVLPSHVKEWIEKRFHSVEAKHAGLSMWK